MLLVIVMHVSIYFAYEIGQGEPFDQIALLYWCLLMRQVTSNLGLLLKLKQFWAKMWP